MARPESQAIGGYYATPPYLVPRIASLIAYARGHVARSFDMVDPCAGDGAAITSLRDGIFHDEEVRTCMASLHACEMEATRHRELVGTHRKSWGGGYYNDPLHGDAFLVDAIPRDGTSLLYLNPPYDLDREHGRLEQRFLARFAPMLTMGGALVLVVPFYALGASADFIARHFPSPHCFRFPDPDFDAFRQVALIATRGPELAFPDARVLRLVRSWSESHDAMPVLPEAGRPLVTMPPTESAFRRWEMGSLDVAGLRARFRPWEVSDRAGRAAPIPGVLPTESAADLLSRRYPVAMPPRPAHIAAGIAAGVFNGARVEPDDAASRLPALLVKGAFDREFVQVDTKTNKDGEVTGRVEVQQPKLVVTVLDLRAKRYVTLRSSTEATGADDVATMTTADLVASYGRSLMGRMLEQCPVLHDPALEGHRVELPEVARPLYRAQREAVAATVKLLGGAGVGRARRRGKAAFILGEIGSGKTSVALASAKAIGARRVLVMVPPHLLDGWRDQAAAVLPEVRASVLSDVAAVDAFAADAAPGMAIGVLSREAAKLGHAWASVGPTCPACGAPVPPGDLAKTRARCEATERKPANGAARVAAELAQQLVGFAPSDPAVLGALRGRHVRRWAATIAERQIETPVWHPTSPTRARAAFRSLVSWVVRQPSLSTEMIDAVLALGAALDDTDEIDRAARWVRACAEKDLTTYGVAEHHRALARRLVMLLPPGSVEQRRLIVALRSMRQPERSYGYPTDEWKVLEEAIAAVRAGEPRPWAYQQHALEDGLPTYAGHRHGSVAAAVTALRQIAALGKWTRTAPCGSPLFTAIPEPRRYPLATYIAKRHPRMFDLLILDEGHEYAGEGSAQGFAAHRLTALGMPTLLLTGSVMNGYADSLFANQWALDPDFRAEFARDDRSEFVRRYGYLKQLVEQRDAKTGKPVVFGSHTDRVETSVRTIGHAPGVLPLFVLRYLLRRAVTLHKSDLALDLPKCEERVAVVEPTPELAAAYRRLQRRLVDQIKRDRFSSLAGKLWGQMAELPSYLDRATADVCGAAFTIAYPEAVGGQVVAEEPALPSATVLPKEQWMIDTARAELAEGRNVMVLAWHVALLPRLARLLEEGLGERCPVLDSGKVAAGKRQAWIDREVIGKGRRVLLVNPVAVQTGLNNLVHFSTQLWMQNPACNAVVYRQTVGRVDRIGQRQETRILFPVYAGTSQEQLHSLLLHKVAVSMSTDGLDGESALAAAGVGEGTGLEGMAVGRQLYELVASGRVVGAPACAMEASCDSRA